MVLAEVDVDVNSIYMVHYASPSSVPLSSASFMLLVSLPQKLCIAIPYADAFHCLGTFY